MGLDSVELLMDVEDAFKISFTDEEAGKIVSIGDFHVAIMKKLKGRKVNEYCYSQRVFYSFRRSLAGFLDKPLKKIRPYHKTEAYFPRENQRKIWEQFSQSISFTFPKLCRPDWWDFVILAGVLLLVGSLFLLRGVSWFWLMFLFMFPLLLSFYLILERISQPLAVEIPSNCDTIGGLTRSLVALNKTSNQYEGGNVKEMLYMIISDQLGVDQQTLTFETQFVRDLNCN